MHRTAYRTELGRGWVVYDGADVVEIRLPGKDAPQGADAGPVPAAVEHVVAALESYYRGESCLVASPELIARAGTTPLLESIYRTVAAIPPGETRSYGEVAAAVGHPRAARAVGSAMAHNPFAPVIPCHRVVGADGRLHGYGGGLHQKAALLEMERRQSGSSDGRLALEFARE